MLAPLGYIQDSLLVTLQTLGLNAVFGPKFQAVLDFLKKTFPALYNKVLNVIASVYENKDTLYTDGDAFANINDSGPSSFSIQLLRQFANIAKTGKMWTFYKDGTENYIYDVSKISCENQIYMYRNAGDPV
jgi:hypothetical protein